MKFRRDYLVDRGAGLANFEPGSNRSGFELKRFLSLATISLVLAMGSLYLQIQASNSSQIAVAAKNYSVQTCRFEVVSPASHGSGVFARSESFSVRVNRLGNHSSGSSLSKATADEGLLQQGSIYEATCSLRPTPEGSKYSALISVTESKSIDTPGSKVNSLIPNLRSAYLTSAAGVTPDSRGLAAGLAIGETSGVSESLMANMKVLSLTHLTAVSGANCAIVAGLVYLVLGRLGVNRIVKISSVGCALIAYVALVGAQPSVVRAACLSGIVLLSQLLGRKVLPVVALASTCLVLLVADPWLAIDVGFALSVSATLGILVIAPLLFNRLQRSLPKPLALAASVSIAAQLTCLPLLINLQGGLSTYSILANLFVEPVVAPVTVLGILACGIAVPLPPLATALSWMASTGTCWIEFISNWFVEFPQQSLPWPVGLLGVLLSVAVVFASALLLTNAPSRLRGIAAVFLVVAALSTAALAITSSIRSTIWGSQNWQVAACDVGQGDAIVIRSKDQTALIDVGRDPKLIDQCLKQLGVDRISLLVLTHFDADHVGGLSGAMRGRAIQVALISPFDDQRWLASKSILALQSSGIELIRPSVGYGGKLGLIEWEVLNPTSDLNGVEDSNDGSLVMLWRGPDWNALTMADLGERGQMRMSSLADDWLGEYLKLKPLILKVSHHGSADQYYELIEYLQPDVSLISVGKENGYGHPTQRLLNALQAQGSRVLRTDRMGSIALQTEAGVMSVSNSSRR